MSYTLAQFEKIDGLLTAYQRRSEPDLTSHESVRDWMRHEWRLLDACIEVLGVDAVGEFASVEEIAADFVTRCLASVDLVECAA